MVVLDGGEIARDRAVWASFRTRFLGGTGNHSCMSDCIVMILGRKCMLMSLSCSMTMTRSKDFKTANTETN